MIFGKLKIYALMIVGAVVFVLTYLAKVRRDERAKMRVQAKAARLDAVLKEKEIRREKELFSSDDDLVSGIMRGPDGRFLRRGKSDGGGK